MPKTPTDHRLALGGPTMGTRWSVLIDEPVTDPTVQSRFQAAVDEVDAQMSTWKPDSDLMRLNAAPLDTWVPLPDRLLTVLEAGLAISRQTDGSVRDEHRRRCPRLGLRAGHHRPARDPRCKFGVSAFRPARRWNSTEAMVAPANRPR